MRKSFGIFSFFLLSNSKKFKCFWIEIFQKIILKVLNNIEEITFSWSFLADLTNSHSTSAPREGERAPKNAIFLSNVTEKFQKNYFFKLACSAKEFARDGLYNVLKVLG